MAKVIWSGWDGVGTAAVTLVGPIAYFTRSVKVNRTQLAGQVSLPIGRVATQYYFR
jgi:hypothetical protein